MFLGSGNVYRIVINIGLISLCVLEMFRNIMVDFNNNNVLKDVYIKFMFSLLVR